jgi:adenylylsulfate kinase
MIERYDIWKRKKGVADETNNVVIGHVKFGNNLDGHPTVVHGGILSLIFDDICGFAYEALGVSHAVTANLHVDYRAPVPAGTEVRVAVQLDSREGRKIFWKAQMTSMDQEILYAEASSLYIIPRSSS